MKLTQINAQIVADSISPEGHILTSLLITFPRFILAEINTHRMLCLAGDMEISFDLPTPVTTSTNFKRYSMTIKEFVEKWHNGAKKRKRHSYEVNLENKEYTAKEISKLINKEVSNIRSKCRDGAILVQNPNKKRSEDFIINGLDYNEYHNGFESKGQNITNRLKSMKIRVLNEDTGLIEHSTVKDCFISGEKQIFKLTLKDGKTLRCSKNHRILTENGWKTLENLSIDDYVITQSFGLLDYEKSDVNKYQYIEGKWVSQFLREIKSEISEKQHNKCLKCEDCITDLHHIIPIHKDISKAFEKDNIIGLCEKCHSKEHKKQGWQVSQYLYGKGVKVSKIEEDGFEQTYDLEIEGKFPNFIANGIVVHNSKNTSSSRAIPFNKMVESISDDPFIPVAWQKEHKGMQGSEYITDQKIIDFKTGVWLKARDEAVHRAKELNGNVQRARSYFDIKELEDTGVTKQLCNRLLEPFMWTTMLITGSKEGWDNFFELRCPQYEYYDMLTGNQQFFKSKKDWLQYYSNKPLPKAKHISKIPENDVEWLQINKGQAEIHMMALAEAIYDAMNESTPKRLDSGEWHIPLIKVIND